MINGMIGSWGGRMALGYIKHGRQVVFSS